MEIWKTLFFDLLDEVEQIPHPMAEEVWEEFNGQAREVLLEENEDDE